jgi:xylulokinase
MSLLGIDVGTTGCKSVVFSKNGDELANAYREYDMISEQAGFAELCCQEVWVKIKETIKEVTSLTVFDQIEALSVSSIGEAMVPVTKNRQILGNSILGNDLRGEEFIKDLLQKISKESVYRINGNMPDVFYSLPKIAWIKKYNSTLYNETSYFLLWADFVCFMLGGKPVTNYSLANRTLLFDINTCEWSVELIRASGIAPDKLAPVCQSGLFLGRVSPTACLETGLKPGVAIISGGHDQCCAALGSGITGNSNTALYGMGTYTCVVPAYSVIPDKEFMQNNQLNIEHHVTPGFFVSFIYNMSGGALVKWFRQTFTEYVNCTNRLAEITYENLFKEIPDQINDIIVIPRFGPTGPPEFLKKSKGTISGLSFNHTRGDILLAILEGISFYFKEFFEIPGAEAFGINKFIVSGGGSKSRRWIQVTSDILNQPMVSNAATEAGSLGAAILASTGSNVFPSVFEGAANMVKKDFEITPNAHNVKIYADKYKKYRELYSYLK